MTLAQLRPSKNRPMKVSGICRADWGSSSIVKYLESSIVEASYRELDVLHDVTLLLPEVVHLLVLGLALEKKDVDCGQVRDISTALKFLADLGAYYGNRQFHLVQIHHIRYLSSSQSETRRPIYDSFTQRW